MFTISRYPVIIFSTPRCGSTALFHYVKNNIDQDVLAFMEPDHQGIEAMENFFLKIQQNKKFLLKLHLQHIHKYEPYIDYLQYDPEPFRIRIQRRDIVKQAVSLYIVHIRNKNRGREIWNMWKKGHNHDTLKNENQRLEFDEFTMVKALRTIKNRSDILGNTNIKFDLDLLFEDIIPCLSTTQIIEYPKPENYDELITFAKKLYHTV